MPELDIEVGGRNYTVACEEGEETHLQTAVGLLNTEAEQVNVASSGRLPESRMLLMAGLMLADRLAGLGDQERYAEERIGQLEERLKASELQVAELKIALEKAGKGGGDNAETSELLEHIAAELESVADTMQAAANA